MPEGGKMSLSENKWKQGRKRERKSKEEGKESCDEDGGGGRWEYSRVELKHARIQCPPHLTQEKKRAAAMHNLWVGCLWYLIWELRMSENGFVTCSYHYLQLSSPLSHGCFYYCSHVWVYSRCPAQVRLPHDWNNIPVTVTLLYLYLLCFLYWKLWHKSTFLLFLWHVQTWLITLLSSLISLYYFIAFWAGFYLAAARIDFQYNQI